MKLTWILLTIACVACAQSSVDWNSQKSEILTHYRDLIRIDTRAGKETKAVEYLRKVLEGEGIPTKTFALDPARAIKIFLEVERAELYRRINQRFDAMLAAGALNEVRALAARGLDPALPAMKAHGVPWLIRHLNGEIALAEAAEGGKRDTRRYTKRQATWFRHQLPGWQWVAPQDAQSQIMTALRDAG